ncbi:MAG: hypothetical protein SNJ71_08765, partial [Bacteroidales bacterium]
AEAIAKAEQERKEKAEAIAKAEQERKEKEQALAKEAATYNKLKKMVHKLYTQGMSEAEIAADLEISIEEVRKILGR